MVERPFRVTRVTENAAGLISEMELAAFSVGTATTPEETDVAYGGLNGARKPLYEYIESLERRMLPASQRTHLRRF